MCRTLALVLSLAIWGCGADDAPGGGEGSDATGSEGTSSGTDTGSDDGAPSHVPADGSENAIRSFLGNAGYKGVGWAPETPTPRDSTDPGLGHGRVQVYLNLEVQASQVAGNDGLLVPHDPWSMAVKELYDDADTLVGKAAMFNAVEEGEAVWTYYCYGPAGRCSGGEPEYAEDAPLIGRGLNVPCGSCHNGQVFTDIP